LTSSPLDQALIFAARSLGAKAQHSAELEKKLKKRGFSDEVTQETLAKMKDLGALGDEEWLEGFVRACYRKNLGKRGVLAKLREKGIKATGLSFEEEGEKERALTFVSKKYSKLDLSDPKQKARLVRGLTAKGFDWEIITEVLEKLYKNIPD